MNRQLCFQMVFACWCGGFVHSITQVILVQLPFCGPDKLDNFYCDVPQVIKLACTDTYVVEVLMVSNSGLLSLVCFLVLLALLLCRHPGHPENSLLGPEQGTLYLCLPPNSGQSDLCAMCIHLPETFLQLLCGQSFLCLLHSDHTYVEPPHLYSQKH